MKIKRSNVSKKQERISVSGYKTYTCLDGVESLHHFLFSVRVSVLYDPDKKQKFLNDLSIRGTEEYWKALKESMDVCQARWGFPLLDKPKYLYFSNGFLIPFETLKNLKKRIRRGQNEI